MSETVREAQTAQPTVAAQPAPAAAPSPASPGGAALQRRIVQRRGQGSSASAAQVQAAAGDGVSGGGSSLPHGDRIQASFGSAHDLSGVQAHVGGPAAAACDAMGASAYATGDHVAFKGAPDLHTAAHEAAHVVQQKGGVQLYGGVGESGDVHEQQADAVADRVVAGQSAADLLAPHAGRSSSTTGVQRKDAAPPQKEDKKPGDYTPLGDIEALSEEDIKAVVFIQEGPHKGQMRYDPNETTPVAVDPEQATYSFADWKKAYERLEWFSEQHDGGGGDSDPNIHDGTKTVQVSSNDAGRAKIAPLEKRLAELEARRGGNRDARKGKSRKDLEAQIAQARKDLDEAKAANSDPVGDEEAAAKREREAEEAEEKRKKGKLGRALDHVDVEMQGDLVHKAVQGDLTYMQEKHSGVPSVLGATREGETDFGTLKGAARGKVSVGKDGVNAEASLEGKAALLDVTEEMHWELPFRFLGEDMNAKLFLKAAGMIGAEGKAQLKANIGGFKPKEPKIDANAISAGVEGFAGAKLTLSAGAALEWQKRPAAVYQDKIKRSGQLVMDLVSVALPGMGYLLKVAGGEKAAASMIEALFKWGQQGTVPLAAIEAAVEGSAGIGGALKGAIGLRGGKFEFMTQANATWGVGLGGSVKVSLDVVEGPKFALLAMGDLQDQAVAYAKEKISEAAADTWEAAKQLWDILSSWWTTDDKARDTVNNNAHRYLPPKERAKLINEMVKGYFSWEDHDCVLKVLEFSKQKGDLSQLGNDAWIRWVLNAMYNTKKHHEKACALFGWKPWN